MKKTIIISLLMLGVFSLNAQNNRAEVLQELEEQQFAGQEIATTATIKSSTRLFGDKNDLTTVILMIPSGSVVTVLDSDSTYLLVTYEENEGFIFRRHADINQAPVRATPVIQPQQRQQQEAYQQQQQQQQQQQGISRFSYLENKYGSNMASRLIAGKIWKGMNAEMVKDSWGAAEKINRVISGNVIKEEWIFRNTWLYFENNTLVEWGPIRN
jgi:hypothetical protein